MTGHSSSIITINGKQFSIATQITSNPISSSKDIDNERSILTPFHSVAINVGARINITIDNQIEPSVRIFAPEDVTQKIRSVVKSNILIIDINQPIASSNDVIIDIRCHSLRSINLGGTLDSIISGINGDLNLEVQGACQVSLLGVSQKLITRITGKCTIQAKDLFAAESNVYCSGSNTLSLCVSDNLSVYAIGDNSLSILGDPHYKHTTCIGISRIHYLNI
jgi:Putative auto-transporter adhesin, head GIN domain